MNLAALLGVGIPAAVALILGIKNYAPTDRSVSASEVTALGARLDAQAIRMDEQDRKLERFERRERAWYAWHAIDHARHMANGWPVEPLPEDLA